MSNPPVGKDVTCPECNSIVIAIVPQGSKLVEREETADGKVWATCQTCGDKFLVYYQTG